MTRPLLRFYFSTYHCLPLEWKMKGAILCALHARVWWECSTSYIRTGTWKGWEMWGVRFEVPILVVLNIQVFCDAGRLTVLQHPRRLDPVRSPQIQPRSLPTGVHTDRNIILPSEELICKTDRQFISTSYLEYGPSSNANSRSTGQ
jgi:hypothetical protein